MPSPSPSPSRARRLLVFAVLAGAACHPTTPTRSAAARAALLAPSPAHTAAPHVAGADAAPEPAPSDAERVLDEARARVGGAIAVRWPAAGGFDDVVAAVGVPSHPGVRGGERMLTWFRLSESDPAPPAPRAVPLGEARVTGLAALDVTGDGRPEMLVFTDGGAAGPAAATSVAVFALPEGVAQPAQLGAESLALDGCATEDDARARLPLARALAASELASASTAALLGRLRFAEPSTLRAAVAPRGVELCELEEAGRTTPRRRCLRVVPGRTPDATLAREVGERLAAFDPASALDINCAESPAPACVASQNAGGATTAEFAGTGASRRLARITFSDRGMCSD